jgi:hypothetical protein
MPEIPQWQVGMVCLGLPTLLKHAFHVADLQGSVPRSVPGTAKPAPLAQEPAEPSKPATLRPQIAITADCSSSRQYPAKHFPLGVPEAVAIRRPVGAPAYLPVGPAAAADSYLPANVMPHPAATLCPGDRSGPPETSQHVAGHRLPAGQCAPDACGRAGYVPHLPETQQVHRHIRPMPTGRAAGLATSSTGLVGVPVYSGAAPLMQPSGPAGHSASQMPGYRVEVKGGTGHALAPAHDPFCAAPGEAMLQDNAVCDKLGRLLRGGAFPPASGQASPRMQGLGSSAHKQDLTGVRHLLQSPLIAPALQF